MADQFIETWIDNESQKKEKYRKEKQVSFNKLDVLYD
jgi:hypothetical protein